MYRVIDHYDGFEDVIGEYNSFDEARAAANKRCKDTDGECAVSIYAYSKKGYRVIA